MQTFNFDEHFRQMERATPDELVGLEQSLKMYLSESLPEQPARLLAWKEAIKRLRERSATELILMNELLGSTEPV